MSNHSTKDLASKLSQNESLPGTTILNGYDFQDFLIQYFENSRYSRFHETVSQFTEEINYENEEKLWTDVLEGSQLFESCKLSLTSFKLLEWIPRSPGLYYSSDAELSRRAARYFTLADNSAIYDPYGKAMMVRGGVGCLRLNSRNIDGTNLFFVSATSSGISHKGFVVALKETEYAKVARLINKMGGIICNLNGTIRYLQPDAKIPIEFHQTIPRVFLLVDEVKVSNEELKSEELDVTAAVSFNGRVEKEDEVAEGNFLTYSHFNPSIKGSLDTCVNWIRMSYVEEKYKGKVITDFDERYSHFPIVTFPLQVIMNPKTKPAEISGVIRSFGSGELSDPEKLINYVENYFAPGSTNISSQGGDVFGVNVSGANNVIGKDLHVESEKERRE